jgi:hypothetical protein
MVASGLFVELEAKPGREDHVAALLRGALPLVEQEEQTTAWFAVRMGLLGSRSSMSSRTSRDVKPTSPGRSRPR